MMRAEVPLSAVARARLSYAEYLAVEASSEARHELHDGELYAMAGGTPAHARLIQQTGWALGNALRAKPCLAQSSAQRIHLADGRALYPDAIVVCPPLVHPPEDPDAIANPVVVVEVLSVVQDAWRVEHYRRTDDGRWTLSVHGPGERVPLDAVDAELSVDDLYDRIEAFGGPARDAPYPPAGVV